MTSVLRLGVYRERIEKYSGNGSCGRRSAEELRNHAFPVDPDDTALPPYSQHPAQPQQPQKGERKKIGLANLSRNLNFENL